MASSTLDSEAAFVERAGQIGVPQWAVDKLIEKKFATFGKYAFSIVYSPQHVDDTPLRTFLSETLDEEPAPDMLAMLRRLFFEAHTMALSDVRQRIESSPDPSVASRKLPVAERKARLDEQQARLKGVIYTPDTIPSNHLVDLCVEQCETGLLTYIKPEVCCSRAQEINAQKKDPTISTDATGMLRLGTKPQDLTCEAGTELKLRSAWQRRSLAMDMAGLASFETIEGWVQFLFSHLLREQPKGFQRITVQQLVDCDRQLFVLAAHTTMGKLQAPAGEAKPLDKTIDKLKDSTEVLQFLSPLPASKQDASKRDRSPPRGSPHKHQRSDKGGGKNKTKSGSKGSSKPQIPDGCVTHDCDGKPLCFGFQTGRCGFKGPPGKRCARGYHKCWKKDCQRPKPYHLCNHAD